MLYKKYIATHTYTYNVHQTLELSTKEYVVICEK